jgi:hypothetical protein
LLNLLFTKRFSLYELYLQVDQILERRAFVTLPLKIITFLNFMLPSYVFYHNSIVYVIVLKHKEVLLTHLS